MSILVICDDCGAEMEDYKNVYWRDDVPKCPDCKGGVEEWD